MDPFSTLFANMIPSIANLGFDLFNQAKRQKQMQKEKADQLKSLYETASDTLAMQGAISGFKTTAEKRKREEYIYSTKELRKYF
jgi:LAS superfamily LD-carboxypeptidase LdcB